ncbi:MAG: hypothetical protein WCO35_01345 [Candidatus Nomurabacteria bacterium]
MKKIISIILTTINSSAFIFLEYMFLQISHPGGIYLDNPITVWTVFIISDLLIVYFWYKIKNKEYVFNILANLVLILSIFLFMINFVHTIAL